MIKGIIFDLDGTIYDYDSCNEIATEKLLKRFSELSGYDVAEVEKQYNQAKKDVKNQLGNVAAAHNRLLYVQRTNELLGRRPVQDSISLYNIYWDTMLENMKKFSYVDSLFDFLCEKDIKIAILTDLTAHIQHRKLIQLEMVYIVDYLVSSEEAGSEKPDDAMFELMLKKMNMNPDEVLMVGDSHTRDILGAQKHGIHTVWIGEKDGAVPQDSIYEYIKELVEHGFLKEV